MQASTRPPTAEERRRAGRAVGVTGALFVVGLYLWQTRAELGLSVPALGLALAVGLLGAGAYQLLRRLRSRGRRPTRMSDTGFVLSAAGTIAVVGAAAAWSSGEWLGLHSAVGSVGAGFTFAMVLWFARVALVGLPPGDRPSPPTDP